MLPVVGAHLEGDDRKHTAAVSPRTILFTAHNVRAPNCRWSCGYAPCLAFSEYFDAERLNVLVGSAKHLLRRFTELCFSGAVC